MAWERRQFVTRLLAEVGPGRCIFCEERLIHRRGRKPVICRDHECLKVYWQHLKWERKERETEAGCGKATQ